MCPNRKIPKQPEDGNRLIDGLPYRQRKQVHSQCKLVEIDSGSVLCEAGMPLEHGYFPIQGSISVVEGIADQKPLELDTVGHEGMLGMSLILGIKTAPGRCVAQTPCLALQVKPGGLQRAYHDHPALTRALQRYMYFTFLELSRTAACLRFHEAGERMARKLLLLQDRAGPGPVFLTQQILADLLGVQRGAISIAANQWQRQKLIRYSRGRIEIIDRKGLEAQSCECYGIRMKNYANLFS